MSNSFGSQQEQEIVQNNSAVEDQSQNIPQFLSAFYHSINPQHNYDSNNDQNVLNGLIYQPNVDTDLNQSLGPFQTNVEQQQSQANIFTNPLNQVVSIVQHQNFLSKNLPKLFIEEQQTPVKNSEQQINLIESNQEEVQMQQFQLSAIENDSSHISSQGSRKNQLPGLLSQLKGKPVIIQNKLLPQAENQINSQNSSQKSQASFQIKSTQKGPRNQVLSIQNSQNSNFSDQASYTQLQREIQNIAKQIQFPKQKYQHLIKQNSSSFFYLL